jgi:hypothetical protein
MVLKFKYNTPVYDGTKFTISYLYNSRIYTIPIDITNVDKKRKYFMIYKKKDITCLLSNIIGPNHDFHKRYVTPSDLGLDDDVKIFFNIGDCITISKDDYFPVNLIK